MYLYSNALSDYSTYSAASLSASTYLLFSGGPTYLTGSATGSSSTSGSATGFENYLSGINGISTSTGQATGTAVFTARPASSKPRRRDLFVTTQPRMRPAPGRDLEDQRREATHLIGSASGSNKSIGMVVGSGSFSSSIKSLISTDLSPVAGASDFHAAIKRQIRSHSYSTGKKLESREVRDMQDLATLILLGL